MDGRTRGGEGRRKGNGKLRGTREVGGIAPWLLRG